MGQAAQKLNATIGGEWLPIKDIARRCKLNRTTVSTRLEDLGYEPDEERSGNCKVFWFDGEMEFALKSAKDTMSAMKIRDLRAAAQLKELKLSEARGELVPINDAIERMQAILSKMYKEFAVLQPKRIAGRLVKAKATADIHRVLKADTDRIFNRLREGDAAFVPEN